jgi:xanthine dehydrogenase accessory factor
MSVPALESSLHLVHNGITVYFCSPGCRAAFRKDPERYAVTT